MNNKKKELLVATMFFLPAVVIYSIFFLYPVLSGILYSFTNWQGLSKTIRFVGFDNFVELFNDRLFLASIKNTFVFAILNSVFQNVFALILALFLDVKLLGRNMYRAIIYMPSVISSIVVGFVWSYILNPTIGVNQIFGAIGLDGFSPQWLGDVDLALPTLVFVTVCQSVGSTMVLYLAGLQDIPVDLYESASIDGVNWWQKIRYITIPLLAPSITISMILTTIYSLKAFEIIFVMTQGGPGNATETMATVMYQYAFRTGRFAYGTAIGVILFVIVLIITVFQLKILQKREVQY
ncbi:MAG TPA: sugar ABC transporter permease [Clostridiales bacterium]|nr:sugar ABC transporter permease [Clostridiales bacterium]